MPPSRKIEIIDPAAERLLPHTGVVLDYLMDETAEPAAMFPRVEEAGQLLIPNYMGQSSDRLIVPSLEIESPLGHQARLVAIQQSNPRLAKLYRDTIKTKGNMSKVVEEKVFGTALRILDTPGDRGLHHIHDTVFPNAIFFIAKVGNGLQPNVYLTQLGNVANDKTGERLPVLALLSASKDKTSEYKFFKAVGAASQKKGYTP